MCAGIEGGCEAAIHSMREMFEDEENEAALLIDATNAFNAANRCATLHNISILCPALIHLSVQHLQESDSVVHSCLGERDWFV